MTVMLTLEFDGPAEPLEPQLPEPVMQQPSSLVQIHQQRDGRVKEVDLVLAKCEGPSGVATVIGQCDPDSFTFACPATSERIRRQFVYHCTYRGLGALTAFLYEVTTGRLQRLYYRRPSTQVL